MRRMTLLMQCILEESRRSAAVVVAISRPHTPILLPPHTPENDHDPAGGGDEAGESGDCFDIEDEGGGGAVGEGVT